MGDDQRPLAKARVSTVCQNDEVVSMTGADGTFALTLVDTEQHLIRVFHDEYVTLSKSVATPSAGVTLRPETRIWVSGVVVDGAGKPVVARVSVAPDAELDLTPEWRSVTSDAQGRFTIRGVTEQPYVIGAQSDEGDAVTREVTPSTKDEGAFRLVIGDASSISGFAVDANGAFLPQARVVALAGGGRGVALATADDRGAFTLRRLSKASQYRLVLVSDQDTDSDQVTAKVGERNAKLVRKIQPKVRGRIVVDGKPYFEARVNGQAASLGTFSVNLGSESIKRIQVRASGFAPAIREVANAGKDVDLGVVELGGRTVKFRVVDAVTGKPVEQATVQLSSDKDEQAVESGVRSSNEGVLTLRGLPATNVEVTVASAPHIPQTIAIDDAAEVVAVKLQSGGAFEVMTVSGARQVEDIAVTAFEEATGRYKVALTDEAGVARIGGLSPGVWTLLAEEDSPSGVLCGQLAAKAPAKGVTKVTVKLKAAAAVSLVLAPAFDSSGIEVLVFSGPLVPKTTAELAKMSALGIETAQEELNGPFVAGCLFRGPHHAVVVRKRGYKTEMFVAPFDVGIAPKQTVTIEEGSWAPK